MPLLKTISIAFSLLVLVVSGCSESSPSNTLDSSDAEALANYEDLIANEASPMEEDGSGEP